MKITPAIVALALALSSWGFSQANASGQIQGTAALVISNGPVVENVTDTTAQIAWSTNVSSSTIVHYGTDAINLNGAATMPWGALTHRVQLKNLKPDTLYYFKAESGQGEGTGTDVQTAESLFQTNPAGSQSAANQQNASSPSRGKLILIAGPIPQRVRDTSAEIWWLLNQEPGASKLRYGTDSSNMSQSVAVNDADDGAAGKAARLTNLQPDTMYNFEIADPSGMVLDRGQFKTESANYTARNHVWITNGPLIEYLSQDTAQVAWSTNVPSGSLVRYGTDPNALSQTNEVPGGQDTHRIALTNLKPRTRYYFAVESHGGGTQVQSQPAPFVTPGEGQQAVRNALPH